MKTMPWFRMYTDFLNDAKLISLSFEDQRHYIGVLALKCSGVLDQDCTPELRDRIVAQRLWIDHSIIREVKKRLAAAALIDDEWQPLGWEKRQFRSDADATGAERQRRYKERHKAMRDALDDANADGNGDGNALPHALANASGDAGVTPPDTDTDTEQRQRQRQNQIQKDASPRGDAGESEKRIDARFLKSQGVDAQYAKDWLAVRRKKRLPLTQTAWDVTCEEAAKAGMTPADAVAMAAREGWGGFKASWVSRAAGGGHGVINRAEAQHENNKRAAAEGVRLLMEREARRNGGATNKPADDDGNTIDMPQ
jgi:hypothetical protein